MEERSLIEVRKKLDRSQLQDVPKSVLKALQVRHATNLGWPISTHFGFSYHWAATNPVNAKLLHSYFEKALNFLEKKNGKSPKCIFFVFPCSPFIYFIPMYNMGERENDPTPCKHKKSRHVSYNVGILQNSFNICTSPFWYQRGEQENEYGETVEKNTEKCLQ